MRNLICITVNLFVYFQLSRSYHNSNPWAKQYDHNNNKCHKLYPKNFISYTPVGNFTAGNYTLHSELKGLRQCVMACCTTASCNVALLYGDRCYHVECVSNELCLPSQRSNEKKLEMQVSMILVKPVLPNENWQDIIDSAMKDVYNDVPEEEVIYSPYRSPSRIVNNDNEDDILSQLMRNLPNMEDDRPEEYVKYRDNEDMIDDAIPFLDKVQCFVQSGENCPVNSECIPLTIDSRTGTCKCILGTEENSQGLCMPSVRPYAKGPTDIDLMYKSNDEKPDDLKDIPVMPTPIVNLTVSVVSSKVQLPENEVTLSAYTVPDENATNSHYNYVWTLVNQPKETFTGNMKQNGTTVTLTQLTEGEYRFKVTVNGTNSYGEAFANVTVLPPKRTNTPPQVYIMPETQTVKLPNTGAVLDGSGSTDDDKIISYHWELTSGPIGYQPPLQDGPTLELKDLKQAGNYTFKLTVQDSDMATNSTTANITVLNHTDYPPEANAGQNVIIYLPNNSLTLDGSLSTDDHKIVSWEWTKAAEDEDKAVDMQNTHSPYLQLSNLSEGVYRFVLKVTDSSAQTSSADVRVFVKPPTNTPPVADAGPDTVISLPQTWVILNGSASHDDHRIESWSWQYLEGPSSPVIDNSNQSIANATGLTKGEYVFSLKVVDDNGNVASDNVTVTVNQNKNVGPVADAGGDVVVSLPLGALRLDGSRSRDDLRVARWRWVREPDGLAAGQVLNHSDTQPVLLLTNIEEGRYVFTLTVWDDQGEQASDTVSVRVKPDSRAPCLLELTLNVPVSSFTQSQLDARVQQMTLLLKDDLHVNVTNIRGEVDSGNTQIIFFLSEKGSCVPGLRALALLDAAGALTGAAGGEAGGGVARARSVLCLSACSGRGVCEPATRSCRCDAFWMQSLWPRDQREPDCAWSVVYLCVAGVVLLAACGAALAGLRSVLPRARARLSHSAAAAAPHYRLLPRNDTTISKEEDSDSETDSDVLFETKSKTSSFMSRPNGEHAGRGSKRNGYKSRRIRT